MSKVNFTNYTREEFKGFLEEVKYGSGVSNSTNNPLDISVCCPSDIDLEEVDIFECSTSICERCWRESIKPIKFKGED